MIHGETACLWWNATKPCDNFQIEWFSTQIPSKNAVKGKFISSWLFQDKRVNILWNRFLALKTPYLPVWQMFHNSFCPEKARKMAWIDVPFAQRFVRIRNIFDISKVPFSSPKYKYNISLNFFRTKGDYKSIFYIFKSHCCVCTAFVEPHGTITTQQCFHPKKFWVRNKFVWNDATLPDDTKLKGNNDLR